MFFGWFKRRQPSLPPELADALGRVQLLAFPGGNRQIDEETGQLHALLRGKLPRDEARQLLCRVKSLLVIAEDKSEARIVPSIQAKAGDRLTAHECRIVYQFLTGVIGALHDDNDGSSRDKAVAINATSSVVGINAEYQWLARRFGEQDRDWSVDLRMHGEHQGRSIESFVIKLRDGSTTTVHFDISSFFGRF